MSSFGARNASDQKLCLRASDSDGKWQRRKVSKALARSRAVFMSSLSLSLLVVSCPSKSSSNKHLRDRFKTGRTSKKVLPEFEIDKLPKELNLTSGEGRTESSTSTVLMYASKSRIKWQQRVSGEDDMDQPQLSIDRTL